MRRAPPAAERRSFTLNLATAETQEVTENLFTLCQRKTFSKQKVSPHCDITSPQFTHHSFHRKMLTKMETELHREEEEDIKSYSCRCL